MVSTLDIINHTKWIRDLNKIAVDSNAGIVWPIQTNLTLNTEAGRAILVVWHNFV